MKDSSSPTYLAWIVMHIKVIKKQIYAEIKEKKSTIFFVKNAMYARNYPNTNSQNSQ